MSLCSIQIIGNAVGDPESRSVAGTDATQVRIAVNGRKKTDATQYFRVTFFGGLAGVARDYVRKGGKVYVQGRFVAREWEDKDGAKRTSLEINGDVLELLSARRDDEPRGAERAERADYDDEIPF